MKFSRIPVIRFAFFLSPILLFLLTPPAYGQPCPVCPSADDAAIQAMIDAATSAGGGTVELEPRVYLVCRPVIVPSNVILKGAGRGATILRGSATVDGYPVSNSLVTSTIAAVAATNVTVTDLTVDHVTCSRYANGVSLLPASGIAESDFTGTPVSNALITRVEVLGSPGFHDYMIWNLRGNHVKIVENWIDGGDLDQSPKEGIESYGGRDVMIAGNTVRNIGGACVNLGSAGLPGTDTAGLFVQNNYLSGCTVGVNLGTSSENGNQLNADTHIRGNVITDIRARGIDIPVMEGTDERNLDISGNTIRNVSGNQSAGIMLRSSEGVLQSSSVVGTTIKGNHIDTITGANAQGIRILDYPNAQILQNTIHATSYEGIAVYGSSDIDIAGNRVSESASIPIGVYSSGTNSSARVNVSDNHIQWSSPYAGILLAGVRRAAVRDNIFARPDGSGSPTPVVTDSTSCGLLVTGSVGWYPGIFVGFSTGQCS